MIQETLLLLQITLVITLVMLLVWVLTYSIQTLHQWLQHLLLLPH